MVGEEETEPGGFVPVADQGGLSLIEVVIAVAIVAVAIALFIAALSTAVMGERNLNERVIGRNLATSQLERVLQAPYVVGAQPCTSYPMLTNTGDYTAVLKISYWYTPTSSWSDDRGKDTGLQYITVTIFDTRQLHEIPEWCEDIWHEVAQTDLIYTLEGFKTSVR